MFKEEEPPGGALTETPRDKAKKGPAPPPPHAAEAGRPAVSADQIRRSNVDDDNDERDSVKTPVKKLEEGFKVVVLNNDQGAVKGFKIGSQKILIIFLRKPYH